MTSLNISLSNHSNSTTTASNTTNNAIYNKLSFVPIFLTIYSIILLFAVGGNILVCLIVKMNPKMHNVTNYLLVNLAVSDFIQTLSSIFHVADFVVKDLNVGDVGCKFQINMFNIPFGSSVLTLVCIAYERYCAVCKPMRSREVKKRIKWIIPSIWLVSIATFFPTLYYCGTRTGDDNQLSCDCTYRWPSLRAKNIYGMCIVIIFYVIPMTVIVGLYSVVIRRLRRAPPGEEQGTVATYQTRRGVVKMLLVTVILFFISWTPYNVLYFLKRLEVDFRSIYKFVWYPALLLAFISCAYNPLIYCFLSQNFRKGFKTALCCCRWRRSSQKMTSSSRGTSSSRSTRRIYLPQALELVEQ